MNAAVTLSNAGWMPVIDASIKKPYGIWRAAQEGDRLLFFCDRFAGFSIGDFWLISFGVLGWMIAKYLKSTQEVSGDIATIPTLEPTQEIRKTTMHRGFRGAFRGWE